MKIHLFTGIGLIFVFTAVLLAVPYPLIATLYCIGAWFLAVIEVAPITSRFQFFTLYFAAVVLGLTLDQPLSHVPFYLLAVLSATTGSFSRTMLFRKFGYTLYPWFEPLAFVVSCILYVLGNLAPGGPGGWKGWVLPAPFLLYELVVIYMNGKDRNQMLRLPQGGYRVALETKAPAFTLRDQDGKPVSLQSFQGQSHILLVFVRGDWCPGCHMMLRTYYKEAHKFRAKNIFVLAIGPDPVGVNREMVEKLGLDFKVLSDEQQRTAMTYGVQLDSYDNEFAAVKYDEGIPLPASFLIDKEGIVRYASRPDKVGVFLDPGTIFPIIENLN